MNDAILHEIENNEKDKKKNEIKLNAEKELFANELLINGINLNDLKQSKKKSLFDKVYNFFKFKKK